MPSDRYNEQPENISPDNSDDDNEDNNNYNYFDIDKSTDNSVKPLSKKAPPAITSTGGGGNGATILDTGDIDVNRYYLVAPKDYQRTQQQLFEVTEEC